MAKMKEIKTGSDNVKAFQIDLSEDSLKDALGQVFSMIEADVKASEKVEKPKDTGEKVLTITEGEELIAEGMAAGYNRALVEIGDTVLEVLKSGMKDADDMLKVLNG